MCSCGGERPNNPAGGNPSPPAAPSAQCPTTCCCSTTRWIDTQAYCGDNARLEGSLTGDCPDGPVTIEILRADGSVAETLNAQTTGRRFTATWISKAQTANWRTDRHRFRFTAAGVTCTSSNEFTFRKRPTTNWILLDRDMPAPNGGYLPPVELHDARLDANRVHYNLKLKLVGAPFPAPRQANAKSLIENAWNDGFNNKRFHRRNCQRGRTCDCAFDCCKAGYRLDVNFVTSGQHVVVTVVASPPPPAPRHRSSMARTGEWGEPPLDEPSVYAHEVGHVLGQYDEYSGGATDTSGEQPTNATTPNLMATPLNTTLFNRHYRWALKFLNDNASGDRYEIIPP
jgi:hypothetical protein